MYNSSFIPKWLWFGLIFLGTSNSLVLKAYISQHGLHGEIEFRRTSEKNDNHITITTNLKPTLQYPDQVWKWSIHEFPVDYRDLSDSRCSDESLGKELIDLTEELGYLIIPGKDHVEFESKNVLIGPKGLWGKSIVLESVEGDKTICASILSIDRNYETYAMAKLTGPVAGPIHFRFLNGNDGYESDSYIHADLYHAVTVNDKFDFTEHKWKLYATDVFDSDKSNNEDICNGLRLISDPENSGDGMSVFDLDVTFGLIKVAIDGNEKNTRTLYKDEVINSLRKDMELAKRSAYIVMYDHRQPDKFLACAKLRTMEPKTAKVVINADGVRRTVEFTQRSPFDPTWANFLDSSSEQDFKADLRFVSSVITYSIRELPPKLLDATQVDHICDTTGGLYNPTAVKMNEIPPPGMGTQDQYPVGDLLGKYKDKTEYLHHKYLLPGLANELSGLYWDVFLPLSGRHSVVHRSVVVKRRAPKRKLCGTIFSYEYGTQYQTELSSAEAVFRYPLVGRVVFRQPLGRAWEDTTIIIESLVHADGSNVNNTFEHHWAIHENPPGKDQYNWTDCCLSAGRLYDPYNLDVDTRHPELYCRPGLEGLCRFGDLSTRHGTLSVAGKKVDSLRLTRRVFTDSAVALSGRHSIMKKSLVIYDDHGPVPKGERMACSIVNGLHSRKAVVKDWFGNGETIHLRGCLEFTQQSEYDNTNVEITLHDLIDIRNYTVHEAPVERDKDFPCERSSLLDVYNPFNITKYIPLPAVGTADQYPLGDLSDKYGMLDGHHTFETHVYDPQLSLFGRFSILGRSVVLYNEFTQRPWACASVEYGYDPSEARKLSAVASFHHPGGDLYGYARLTQLVYSDGSASDTVIEVKLRHSGVRDRNLTHNHMWNIFENPVGVNATVKKPNTTHCVAGGRRWNPYFTQLADPLNAELYNQECGPDSPLRCDVGDLTARLGPLSIGGPRQVFIDSNLPLEGSVSAMGRPMVIFGPERSREPLACANIEPDSDIIKYVNIAKPRNFVLSQFLDEVRQVMGVPEWMVGVDPREKRIIHHGTCVQILLHFMGPQANKLAFDFSSLMASGHLDAPSISIPGYVNPKRQRTIAYQQCKFKDPVEKKKSASALHSLECSKCSIRSSATSERWSSVFWFPFLLVASSLML